MSESFSLLVGGALLALLIVFLIKGLWTARALDQEPADFRDESAAYETCPDEFVKRIFSEDDREFIRGLECQGLERLFDRERRAVALLWVQQTANAVRQIMREHAAAARQSADLQFATEVRLFAEYSGLMLCCGGLYISIQLAGPLSMKGLAAYVQRLSQKIADAQQAFAAAAGSRSAGLQGV